MLHYHAPRKCMDPVGELRINLLFVPIPKSVQYQQNLPSCRHRRAGYAKTTRCS